MRRISEFFLMSLLIGICFLGYAEAEWNSRYEDEFARRYALEIGYCTSLQEFVDKEEVLRDNMPYDPGIVVETDCFAIHSIELIADGKYVWAKIPITLKEENAIIRPSDCLSETDPFYTPLAVYTDPVCFFNVWIDGPHFGPGAQCALSASDDHTSMIFFDTWVCCYKNDCECKQSDYIPVTITIWLSRYEDGTINNYNYRITVQCPIMPHA